MEKYIPTNEELVEMGFKQDLENYFHPFGIEYYGEGHWGMCIEDEYESMYRGINIKNRDELEILIDILQPII